LHLPPTRPGRTRSVAATLILSVRVATSGEGGTVLTQKARTSARMGISPAANRSVVSCLMPAPKWIYADRASPVRTGNLGQTLVAFGLPRRHHDTGEQNARAPEFHHVKSGRPGPS